MDYIRWFLGEMAPMLGNLTEEEKEFYDQCCDCLMITGYLVREKNLTISDFANDTYEQFLSKTLLVPPLTEEQFMAIKEIANYLLEHLK